MSAGRVRADSPRRCRRSSRRIDATTKRTPLKVSGCICRRAILTTGRLNPQTKTTPRRPRSFESSRRRCTVAGHSILPTRGRRTTRRLPRKLFSRGAGKLRRTRGPRRTRKRRRDSRSGAVEMQRGPGRRIRQVLEQSRSRGPCRAGQARVPSPQDVAQGVAVPDQLLDAAAEEADPFLRQPPDFAARSPALPPGVHNPTDLLQGEADGQGVANQAHMASRLGRIDPIVGARPPRRIQQAEPFVVPERVSADPGLPRQLARSHRSLPPFTPSCPRSWPPAGSQRRPELILKSSTWPACAPSVVRP